MTWRGRTISCSAAVVAAFCLSGCTYLFFQPTRPYVINPGMLGLRYQVVHFRSGRYQLTGWFLPSAGRARGTILFAHGNGQNMGLQIGAVEWLPASHYNVFTFDYRGYGSSEGRPSVPGAVTDIQSALRTLIHYPGVDRNRIVILGQSLGGALAIYVVAHTRLRVDIRGLVVDSAFADYHEIARQVLDRFWLTWAVQWPLSFTVSDHYSPIRAIAGVSPIPILIIHSVDDQVVPVEQAEQLYRAAKQPKTLWILHRGGHIQTFNYLNRRQRFLRYLKRLLGPLPAMHAVKNDRAHGGVSGQPAPLT